mgnify:CR=1 FL=1
MAKFSGELSTYEASQPLKCPAEQDLALPEKNRQEAVAFLWLKGAQFSSFFHLVKVLYIEVLDRAMGLLAKSFMKIYFTH